jgi:2,4-dichlorophenol 6-monooxygenase
MFSNLGIDDVLVEAHPGAPILPKAHILNQGTAEVLDQYKLWEKIVPFGTPQENARYFKFVTSFCSGGPLDRVTLGKASCSGWNGNPDADEEKDYLIYG